MLGPALLSLAVPALLVPAPGGDVCVVRRASVDVAGLAANDHSRKPSISADGEWIAFESEASNLVPGDTNGASDVFVKHVPSGAIERVSVRPGGPNGGQANGPSIHATISADARYVVFESEATDLVAGDTNGLRDVFLHDRTLFETRRVSVSSAGVEGNAQSGTGGSWRGSTISGDGAVIAFQSGASNLVSGDTNGLLDLFLHFPATGLTTRGSFFPGPFGQVQANGASQDPSLSFDGRYLAYTSSASNLVTSDTNGDRDVFVLDRVANTVVRASVDSLGNESNADSYQPALAANGLFVAFESFATNLVPGDTNGIVDVFRRDLVAATTERASVSWTGAQANNYAVETSISADGDRVAFTSAASNLVPNDNGVATVYVRDFALQTTERWGVDANGSPGFAGSAESSLASDGRTMAFGSLADLDGSDANGAIDVFHRRCGPTGFPYCRGVAVFCPCLNGGSGGAGCENSAGTGGGLLGATGMPRVSLDTVTLQASGLIATAPILFFQGTTAPNGTHGTPFGDGLRCAGGMVVRLGTKVASGGAAAFGHGLGSDPAISLKGGVPAAGAVRYYQGWYRDTQPFCMPEGFNFTNGLRIEWAP